MGAESYFAVSQSETYGMRERPHRYSKFCLCLLISKHTLVYRGHRKNLVFVIFTDFSSISYFGHRQYCNLLYDLLCH